MTLTTIAAVKERALAHLRRDLTLNALDDFVPLSAVTWEVRERLNVGDEEATFKIAAQVLRDLLNSGVVEIGDVIDGRFKSWALSLEDAVSRAESAFKVENGDEAAWLKATDKANRWLSRYESLLAELRS